jgi:hypothetical protein
LYAREDRKQHIAENIIKKHFNHPNSDITLWHGTTRDHWPQVRGVKGMVSILSAEMDRQAATDSGFEPFMILEDDIDVTPQFHDLNNHHYFSYPQDADCLYFGLTSAGMGGSWKTLHTAVDAWDGDYDLNQQWTQIHNMLGSHAIMIMSPEFMKHLLRCYQYAVGFIIASDPNNTTNPMPYDIPVAMHMRHYNVYALRQPVFYQAKTATVNGTTIDLGGQQDLTLVTFPREEDTIESSDEYRAMEDDLTQISPGKFKVFGDFEPHGIDDLATQRINTQAALT